LNVQFKIFLGTSLLCTWGNQGVAGFDCGNIDSKDVSSKNIDRDNMFKKGKFFHSVAEHPPKVVDTLGAGDTFTATVIAVKSRYPSVSLKVASDVGCFVAGRKVGQAGFKNLKSSFDTAIRLYVK
jgi:hypothetical protein